MSNNNEEEVDLSGNGDESPQLNTTPNPQAPVKDPYRNSIIRREEEDAKERRAMRITIYMVVMLFAVFFLAVGLSFALDVGYGLLNAKGQIVTALTQQDPSKCLIPLKCITENTQAVPANQGVVGNMHLNTDWLSAGSLITIVAFIFGVGLTLLLTLLKASFRHPTDQSSSNNNDKTTIELATPLSELLVSGLNYLKNKFSK